MTIKIEAPLYNRLCDWCDKPATVGAQPGSTFRVDRACDEHRHYMDELLPGYYDEPPQPIEWVG